MPNLLLKLSGEAMGGGATGIDPGALCSIINTADGGRLSNTGRLRTEKRDLPAIAAQVRLARPVRGKPLNIGDRNGQNDACPDAEGKDQPPRRRHVRHRAEQ